jgi:hypothetical protein
MEDIRGLTRGKDKGGGQREEKKKEESKGKHAEFLIEDERSAPFRAAQ